MSHLYDANPAHLRRHGLKARDAQNLFQALCTLTDYEGAIVAAGGSVDSVCNAIRKIVDGQDCQENCCAPTPAPGAGERK